MKVISLNLWLGNLIVAATEFLKKEQADIMCLQEVFSSDVDYPLFESFRSLEPIKAAFPDYHVYYSPVREFRLLGGKLELGNAIVSRFPIVASKTMFMSGKFAVYDTVTNIVGNTRNLQLVTLAYNGQPLQIINHQAFWDKNPLGNEVSVQKMQVVADIVTEVDAPLILAGDLNLAPESPALKPLQALLHDLTLEYRLPTTLSSFGKAEDVACDHIFVSDGVTVQRFMASDALVSDHKALVLECSLSQLLQNGGNEKHGQ